MGSRATILATDDSHIYEETSASEFYNDNFIGYGVTAILSKSELNECVVDRKFLKIDPTGDLKDKGMSLMFIYLMDIVDINEDEDDYEIVIRGGTYSAEMFTNLRK